jgi:hypothetical protein
MSLQRPRPPFSIAMIVATLLIASGAGCHRPSLFVCDAFRLPGEPSTLEARFTECAMRREKRADMPQTAVAGLNVRFYVQNELLGEAKTDENGIARVNCDLPDDATHFRAEAISPRGEKLAMEALIFGFPRGRTLLVCDIDETVSATHYRDLFFADDDLRSQPIDEAAAVLRDLAPRYGLVYLTARPGFLLEKTKRWLKRHEFPPAPIITTSSLTQNLRLDRYKAGRIEYLMALWVQWASGSATPDPIPRRTPCAPCCPC